MQDDLEQKNLQHVFLSTVSHELKTPLTSMLGFTQAISRTVDKKIANYVENPLYTEEELVKQREHLQTITRQIKRLENLINDLLDISVVENGQLFFNWTKVDLTELLKTICYEQQFTSTQHQIRYDVPAQSLLVYGDNDRLNKLFSNILINAIKYSPQADKVEVRLKQQDDRCVITVRDYGIGISAEEKNHVFELYYRSQQLDRKKFGGLGLGLYLSKQIVLMHRGTIEIESELGQGSTFIISLPRID